MRCRPLRSGCASPNRSASVSRASPAPGVVPAWPTIGDQAPRRAVGGGYSGVMSYRDGKPMCPAVAPPSTRWTRRPNRDGIDLVVISGFRSDAEQAVLFARHPDPQWVAPPGHSRHRDATELDLSMGGGLAWPWLAPTRRFGFVQRYRGSRGTTDTSRAAAVSLVGADRARPGGPRSWVPAAYRALDRAPPQSRGVPPVLLGGAAAGGVGLRPAGREPGRRAGDRAVHARDGRAAGPARSVRPGAGDPGRGTAPGLPPAAVRPMAARPGRLQRRRRRGAAATAGVPPYRRDPRVRRAHPRAAEAGGRARRPRCRAAIAAAAACRGGPPSTESGPSRRPIHVRTYTRARWPTSATERSGSNSAPARCPGVYIYRDAGSTTCSTSGRPSRCESAFARTSRPRCGPSHDARQVARSEGRPPSEDRRDGVADRADRVSWSPAPDRGADPRGRTSSRRTGRRSTSGSVTTRATRTSRSASTRRIRGSTSPVSATGATAATSGRSPTRRACGRR